jgi:hypothetical protein
VNADFFRAPKMDQIWVWSQYLVLLYGRIRKRHLYGTGIAISACHTPSTKSLMKATLRIHDRNTKKYYFLNMVVHSTASLHVCFALLHACLRLSLLACIYAFFPPCLLACLLACLLFSMLAYMPTCMLACMQAYGLVG